MRFLITLLVGVLAGAWVAGLWTALRAREHAHPRGVMQGLQAHLRTLDRAEAGGRCREDEIAARWPQLAALAREIDFAFPQASEPVFARHRSTLQDAVGAANGPGCAGLRHALNRIDETCEACHREFR